MLTTSPSVCSSECPNLGGGGGGGQPQWGWGGREATTVVIGEGAAAVRMGVGGGGGSCSWCMGGWGQPQLEGGGGATAIGMEGVTPRGDGGGRHWWWWGGGGSQGGGSCCRGEGPWRGCLCLYFQYVDVYLELLHGPCVLFVVNRILKHMQVLSIHSKMKQKRNKVFAKFRSMTRYFTLLF